MPRLCRNSKSRITVRLRLRHYRSFQVCKIGIHVDLMLLRGSLLIWVYKPETVGITLRQLPILLANAAEGTLGKEKQGVFDALGINIADDKGELRDFITVLSQFRTAFRREGLLTEAGRITTPGVAVLSEIFDKRYANAVGQMIAGVDKIEENMAGVGRVGTLDEKFAVHSETLFAAVKRFESARESLGLRVMMTMNQDDNFIRMFDGLTAKTGEFIDFVKANSGQIASIGTAIIDGLAWAGRKDADGRWHGVRLFQ